ncbi:hypothetical protein C0Q70_21191 [Pomacea canaliculata]|uniref:Uncharacterized protein n=1 Tax=Pomacea canaliculata TaxID=400727 RepID=A0A2T7NBV2_POMCA|nr:hypothetical protein C0Q70_21191 [Pomacea canaliculata]
MAPGGAAAATIVFRPGSQLDTNRPELNWQQTHARLWQLTSPPTYNHKQKAATNSLVDRCYKDHSTRVQDVG